MNFGYSSRNYRALLHRICYEGSQAAGGADEVGPPCARLGAWGTVSSEDPGVHSTLYVGHGDPHDLILKGVEKHSSKLVSHW